MRINVTKVMTELGGAVIDVPTGSVAGVDMCKKCAEAWSKSVQPLTLRLVCTRALTSMQNSQGLTGEQKFERAELARRIYNEETPSLSAPEVTMIKDVIGSYDGPLIVLQAFELLDPPDDEAAGDD